MPFAWPCFLWIWKHKLRLYRTTGQGRHLTWVGGAAPGPSSSGAMLLVWLRYIWPFSVYFETCDNSRCLRRCCLCLQMFHFHGYHSRWKWAECFILIDGKIVILWWASGEKSHLPLHSIWCVLMCLFYYYLVPQIDSKNGSHLITSVDDLS